MNQHKIALYIDLLVCIVVLPLIITLVPIGKWIEKYPLFSSTLITFIYAIYIGIRIINFPQLFMRQKYLQIAAYILLLGGAAYLMSIFPYAEPLTENSPKHLFLREHMRGQTVRFFFLTVSSLSLSISLTLELFRQIIARKEIEIQKDQTELHFYKSQINPHFLFNTLNTLYGLIIQKSEKTEEAFMQFSDMVKYTYSHAADEMIGIKEEISYIQHYINLQSLRLNEHTQILWKCTIDDENVQIPPMLLIPFIENTFKYGVSSSVDCLIRLDIEVKTGYWYSNRATGSCIVPKRKNRE